MTKVAQAYTHLAPFDLGDIDLRTLGDVLSKNYALLAEKTFPFQVALSVSFEEGSLISRTTARAIGTSLLTSVILYGDLKSGLQEVIGDARSFSAAVIDLTLKAVDAPSRSVFHTERRTETPGRLYRALNDLEDLNRSAPSLSAEEIRHRLAQISKALQVAVADLPPEDAAIIKHTIQTDYQSVLSVADSISLLQVSRLPSTASYGEADPILKAEASRVSRRLARSETTLTFRPPQPTRRRYSNEFVASGSVPSGRVILEDQQPLGLPRSPDSGTSLVGESEEP